MPLSLREYKVTVRGGPDRLGQHDRKILAASVDQLREWCVKMGFIIISGPVDMQTSADVADIREGKAY